MSEKAKKTAVIAFIAALMLSIGSSGSAKKSKIQCEDLKKGVGFYSYWILDLPAQERLDDASYKELNSIFLKVSGELMQKEFPAVVDISSVPELAPEKVIKSSLKGALWDINEKELIKEAAKRNLGYVIFCLVYSMPEGFKDGAVSLNTEEMPNIILEGGEYSISAQNYFCMEIILFDVKKSKKIEKSKSLKSVGSYKHWFVQKYPDFFNGESDELPEGVDYNSIDSYALFIEENLFKTLASLDVYTEIKACSGGEK